MPDLISGLYRAIAQRTSGFVRGVARNLGFVRILVGEWGVSITVPEEPDMVVAYGAALLAAEYIS